MAEVVEVEEEEVQVVLVQGVQVVLVQGVQVVQAHGVHRIGAHLIEVMVVEVALLQLDKRLELSLVLYVLYFAVSVVLFLIGNLF